MMAHTERTAVLRPRMVLGHTDSGYAASCGHHFRGLGWDVYQADSGQEARRLALLLNPAVVILDTELPGESGWLACTKLVREQSGVKVILVAPRGASDNPAFAAFVGAAGLVRRADGVAALAELVAGSPILTAP